MLDKPPTISIEPDPLDIDDKPLKQQEISTAMKHYLQVVREYSKMQHIFISIITVCTIYLFSFLNFNDRELYERTRNRI